MEAGSFRSYKQIRVSKRNNHPLNTSNFQGGILQGPPTTPFSLSSISSLPPNRHPPLLPLPTPNSDIKSRNRGLSCSPINRKIGNRKRNLQLTLPKKTNPSVKENIKGDLKPRGSENCSDLEKFSGSVVFTLSPPPSSLPLPTFFLRPKRSCNAQAAGIDAGATDNLRRLLRLE